MWANCRARAPSAWYSKIWCVFDNPSWPRITWVIRSRISSTAFEKEVQRLTVGTNDNKVLQYPYIYIQLFHRRYLFKADSAFTLGHLHSKGVGNSGGFPFSRPHPVLTGGRCRHILNFFFRLNASSFCARVPLSCRRHCRHAPTRDWAAARCSSMNCVWKWPLIPGNPRAISSLQLFPE